MSIRQFHAKYTGVQGETQVRIAITARDNSRQRYSLAFIPAVLFCVLALSACNMATQGMSAGESALLAKATNEFLPLSATSVATSDSGSRPNHALEALSIATPTSRPTIRATDSIPSNDVQLLELSAEPTETLVVTHRVVPGDTLTRIAEKYSVSVASLLRANELANPDFLVVGQIIALPAPPVDYTPSFHILPDSRIVRSIRADEFDVEQFLRSRGGALSRMTVVVTKRNPYGSMRSDSFAASEVIRRVSLEYSVDARVLLAFLEHFAGLVTGETVDEETRLYPLLAPERTSRIDRAGLYAQISWLADRLNEGYYSWKYRGDVVLELLDGSRLYYASELNAGTVAVQHALAQMPRATDWRLDSNEAGIYRTYADLFGDPFQDDYETVPADLGQPPLTLPFPRGEIWRFTGGFHGGWGNGSAWAAVDFAPPAEARQAGPCYISSFPVTAVARGTIARLDEGTVVLDLDEDSKESTGWTVLYLHVDYHDSLVEGQLVEAGNIIGFPSCLGGFTTATHLHIARRYNGEWLPADCNRCPQGVAAPPFVMSSWRVVGLASQLYQGFMINQLDSRSVVAEQGRFTSVNEISW